MFAYSVTAFISEGRETEAASLSTSVYPTSVFVQWWMADATSISCVGDRASDVYACLQQCRDSWSPRCRMVSYNMETGICTKFTKAAATGKNSLRFSRNIDAIVAANSEKHFTSMPNTDYVVDDLSSFSDTGSAELCTLFCHLHPACNVGTFGSHSGLCWLKSKTALNPSPFHFSNSFVA